MYVDDVQNVYVYSLTINGINGFIKRPTYFCLSNLSL